MKKLPFPPELDQQVDFSRVNVHSIRPWITSRLNELLGFDDDILVGFVCELLSAKDVDGKAIQIQLTGFLERETGKFMKELWGQLINAEKCLDDKPALEKCLEDTVTLEREATELIGGFEDDHADDHEVVAQSEVMEQQNDLGDNKDF